MPLYEKFMADLLPFLVDCLIEHNDLSRQNLTKRPFPKDYDKKRHDLNYHNWVKDIANKSNCFEFRFDNDGYTDGSGTMRFDSETSFTELHWLNGFARFRDLLLEFLQRYMHSKPSYQRARAQILQSNILDIKIGQSTLHLTIMGDGVYNVKLKDKP